MSTPFGSVEYRSVDRFEESYIKEIQDDAFQLIQDHIWWNNPVNLYDKIEYPLYLTGDSYLLLLRIQDLKTGFTRSVDFRDDLILGLVDYTKTLGILSILSRNHDITWKLFQTASCRIELPIGTIENGEISVSAIKHMTDTIDHYKITERELSDSEFHARIYHQYFDENHEPIFQS